MMKKNVINLIGNTPLVKLSQKTNKYENINIYVKLEYYNPTGSIKDRIVKYILEDAFANHKINPNTTIIEASSGNTACSIAMLSSYYGLKSILCTNTKCSTEKLNAIKAFGASEVIVTESCASSSPNHYQNVALKMAKENPTYYHINQYDNKLNADAYFHTLGPEIADELNCDVDYFICAGSTGGTITGTGRYLKEKNKNTKVILVDPVGSVFYDYFESGGKIDILQSETASTNIEGIGKDAIPKVLDFDLINDVFRVNDIDAINMCHTLSLNEGIFSGGSGGANVFSALNLAKKISLETYHSKKEINIVTVIPDTGFKYMSKIYNPEWVKKIAKNVLL
jgi:cysteine synthase